MSGYIGSKASVTVISPETDSRYVNVAGDTMTGGLTIPSMTSTGAITASGGVYLGGTGAANLLDDYEEGTFTPTLYASGVNLLSAGCFAATHGRYTKVGREVHCTFFLLGQNHSALSLTDTVCYLQGLPFNMANSVYGETINNRAWYVTTSIDGFGRGNTSMNTGDAPLGVLDGYGLDQIALGGAVPGSSPTYWIKANNNANCFAGFYLRGSCIYYTS